MTPELRAKIQAGTRRWGRKASPQGFQSLIGHPVAVENEKILFEAFLQGGPEGLKAKMQEMFGSQPTQEADELEDK